jgi:hypothetical protein
MGLRRLRLHGKIGAEAEVGGSPVPGRALPKETGPSLKLSKGLCLSFESYDAGMKKKTSITLSKEVLIGIDRITGSKQSRSALIEAVLTQYLRDRARAQVEARDLELINTAADELNAEVDDVLRISRPRPTGA